MRTQLEYAGVVWDNSIKKNINAVEKVQRQAARYIMNDYNQTSSVTSMLEELQLGTLQDGEQDFEPLWCIELLIIWWIFNQYVYIRLVSPLEVTWQDFCHPSVKWTATEIRSFQLPSPSGMDYYKLGNIRWGFIFAIFAICWWYANSTPRELLINYITHIVNVTSRYIQIDWQQI